MKKPARPRLLCCLLCLLLLSGLAFAEPLGTEIRRSTTLRWGHLSTLSGAENDILQDLLASAEIQTVRYGAGQDGYGSCDVLLRDVSVFDIAFQVRDALYLEQSSGLGGQTVAFSPQEMASFVSRLSARSSGLLPGAMHPVLSLLLLSMDSGFVLPETPEYTRWKETMPVRDSIRQPKVYIQPLYGARADTVTYSAEAVIQWMELYLQAVQAAGEADARPLTEEGQALSQALWDLPQTLRASLAGADAPLVLRTVYDAEDRPVVRQIEANFPGQLQCLLEWTAAETAGLPSAYLSLSAEGFSCTLLISAADTRTVAEASIKAEGFALDVLYTAVENMPGAQAGQTTARREWMLQSDAWFGADALVSVVAETTTSAGSRRQTDTTDWSVRGLVPGATDKVLTVTTQTTQHTPAGLLDAANAIRPGQMDDAALDAWLAQTEDNWMQCILTIFGRLPPDAAAYLLGVLEASG